MASVADRVRGWFRRTPKVVVPRTILVIDSNTNDRRSTISSVTRLGYEALEAVSVAHAMRQLEERRPDCVLLALDLKDSSGLDALQKLRELDEDLPVIMLARDWHDSRTAEAMRHGALAYLAKPFGQDDLRELLPHH
jgi:DNA-binding NtrC family response regulator